MVTKRYPKDSLMRIDLDTTQKAVPWTISESFTCWPFQPVFLSHGVPQLGSIKGIGVFRKSLCWYEPLQRDHGLPMWQHSTTSPLSSPKSSTQRQGSGQTFPGRSKQMKHGEKPPSVGTLSSEVFQEMRMTSFWDVKMVPVGSYWQIYICL